MFALQFARQAARQKQESKGKKIDPAAKCLICGSDKMLVRHHVTYRPPKVVILCASCHWKVHNSIWKIPRDKILLVVSEQIYQRVKKYFRAGIPR